MGFERGFFLHFDNFVLGFTNVIVNCVPNYGDVKLRDFGVYAYYFVRVCAGQHKTGAERRRERSNATRTRTSLCQESATANSAGRLV